TIRRYLGVVNKHYKEKGYDETYDKDDDSNGAKLLSAQEKFKDASAKRNPLTDKTIVKMEELSHEDPLGFNAAVYDFVFVALGRFGGFRQQEFCMDTKRRIKYYVMPDGTKVVRAFTRKNFIFCDVGGIIITDPLANRELAAKIGTEYDIQKNRMNGQIIVFVRLSAEYRRYCPVVAGQNIVTRAEVLGNIKPEDPLCVYKDEEGKVQHLTGMDVTDYFRAVLKLESPNISEAGLKLISTHSIRVKACVELSEAGKDGPYIKLRLRWLSNCFEIYLRNTNTIATQHADALDNVHSRMTAFAMDTANMNEIIHVSGDNQHYHG
ncbi:hypothetical protein ACHAXR_002105, partial [Thalassiosira sp. AJA248-18]